MTLYAESSAVLSWLLGEIRGAQVAKDLGQAETVFTSSLTLIECDRSLMRALALERIAGRKASSLKKVLATVTSHWAFVILDDKVVEWARQRFPVEPIRTLDAIHLASAASIKAIVPEMEMLSLDDRVRKAAIQMGIHCRP